ncbi:hypothetical protein [uncultured Fibrella sp.]|uniref:hypothetical protein n=1 Tax=uncultured Fibrella sp. TaxID=1284596 RepID=UPI0035CBD2A4
MEQQIKLNTIELLLICLTIVSVVILIRWNKRVDARALPNPDARVPVSAHLIDRSEPTLSQREQEVLAKII